MDNAGNGSNDSEEVRRLREQISRLQRKITSKEENGDVESGANVRSRSRSRNVFAGILIGIGLILLLIAIPVLWLHRTLLTTDGWVAAVGPLAADSAVQADVASALAQKYSQNVNIESWVRQKLPSQSQDLAPPLAAAINMAIKQFALLVVKSNAFAQLWSEMNRVSHSVAIAGLTRAGNVMNSDLAERIGSLNVDFKMIIERLQSELQKRGFTFTLPQSINSTVTLLQSSQLAQIVNFVRTLDAVAPWLTLLSIITIAGAIGIAIDRRKTLLALGVGLVVIGFLLIITDAIVKSHIVGQVSPNAILSSTATGQAYETITSGLVSSLRAAVLFGIILWLGAVALGPSSSMVSMRQATTEWIHGIRKSSNPGRFELWIGSHRTILQIGVLILAGIALIIPSQRTVSYILILVASVIVLEFLVELFGRVNPPPSHA